MDTRETLESLPRIIEIMGKELNWTQEQKAQEFDKAVKFLITMGLPPPKEKLTLNNNKNKK